MIDKIVKEASVIRRNAAQLSILAFAYTYLSHYLEKLMSSAHREIYDILFLMQQKRGIRFVFVAPREFGKSTLITLIYILYCVCYQREKFIVILSNTSKRATAILDNVKKELVANPLIQQDFPEVFELNGEPKPPRWRNNDIETRTGIKVIAAGINEASRGLRHLQYRPSLVIGDDIEKGDPYASIDTLDKTRESFNKTFLPIGSAETNFILLGTFFHPYCLLGEYLDKEKHPDWIRKTYKALVQFPENQELWQQWSNVYNNREAYNGETGPEAARKFYILNQAQMDEGGKSLWPEKWSVYDLMVEHENNPIVFSSERQNEPFDPKTQSFKRDETTFWSDTAKSDEDLLKSLSDDLSYVGACDPALGKDFSAIIVLVRDNKTKILYVLVADINRRDTSKTIDDIVAYAKRFPFTKFVVEANNFQQLMVDQLKERCQKEGVSLNVDPVKNTSHKTERILSLQPLLRTGGLRLNRNHRRLNEQLFTFPLHAHDDGPDALQMSTEALRTMGEVKVYILGGRDNDWYNDYHKNLGWPGLF